MCECSDVEKTANSAVFGISNQSTANRGVPMTAERWALWKLHRRPSHAKNPSVERREGFSFLSSRRNTTSGAHRHPFHQTGAAPESDTPLEVGLERTMTSSPWPHLHPKRPRADAIRCHRKKIKSLESGHAAGPDSPSAGRGEKGRQSHPWATPEPSTGTIHGPACANR